MEQSRDESRLSNPRENVFPRMNSNQASRLPPCGHPWCRSEKKRKKGRRKIPCCRQNQHLARVSKQVDQQPPSYEKLLREELPPPAYHELEEVHTYWPWVHVENVVDDVDGNELPLLPTMR